MNEKGQLEHLKPVMKIDDLELNKKVHVVFFKAVNTRFGRKIVAECEKNIIFLPSRFNDIADEEIENMNKNTNIAIVYQGKKDCGAGKKASIIEFITM